MPHTSGPYRDSSGRGRRRFCRPNRLLHTGLPPTAASWHVSSRQTGRVPLVGAGLLSCLLSAQQRGPRPSSPLALTVPHFAEPDPVLAKAAVRLVSMRRAYLVPGQQVPPSSSVSEP